MSFEVSKDLVQEMLAEDASLQTITNQFSFTITQAHGFVNITHTKGSVNITVAQSVLDGKGDHPRCATITAGTGYAEWFGKGTDCGGVL